ncbi:hypothetical protein Mapa_005833 [Marchantia paleacea]|nr:hypothetical protein Mapa_005833 [Marchantia paleacea]
MGNEDSRSPATSSGSGSGISQRRFLSGWFSSDKNEAEMEPEKSENYVVADPKTGAGHSGPMHYLWDLIRDKSRWKESCQISDPMKEEVQNNETWQARLSLLILKVLWYVNGPLKSSGQWMEYMFNLFISNDGFFKTLYRVLFKRSELIIRQRGSEDFLSILGAMDPRFALYTDKSSYGVAHSDDVNALNFAGTDYGSRSTADVLVMASKLAYENAACVKKVVTQSWKMHFVEFYDCWNEFHQEKDTQVFIFTDQPKDARAIVVAFRGTEVFNAIDWSTDMDFSWFEIKGLGRVHVGFLEALGLGDRKRMETFVIMNDNMNLQPSDQAGSAMSGLPADVVAEPTKILAYDDITKRVKKLMEENPEAKLFVTGHSLGGALGSLYCTLLFFNNEDMVTTRLGALYTFGQPRVGGEEYCKFMISKIHESKYWRIVYGNDLVPRVPFDNKIFLFKHCGYCYYYNERYVEMTMVEAPNANYFTLSFKTVVMQRLVALYELFVSLFSGWIYGADFRENYASTGVRLLGLILPGIAAHIMNNYVNAIRLGPSPLEAKLHEIELLEDRSKSLFKFIASFMGKKSVPANAPQNAHEE